MPLFDGDNPARKRDGSRTEEEADMKFRKFSVIGLLALGAFITSSATSARAADWPGQADWKKTIATAKKEGKIIITGPIGRSWRAPLMAFEKEFGIKVEFTGAWGRDFYPRLEQERKAGKFLWDLRVTAADSRAYRLVRAGKAIAAVRDYIVLPEVLDDKNWIGGFDSIFADNAKKHFIGFGMLNLPVAWVNRNMVSEKELSHLKQLTDPKWKGKISSADPRAGAAMVGLSKLLAHKDYGEKFMMDLIVGNKAVITRNIRLQVDWLVRGKYPIALAPTSGILLSYKRKGLAAAKNIFPLAGLPSYSSGFAGVIAIKNPPHPNAAKLYANWVLTQKVQQRIATAANYNSRRTDVKPGDPLVQVDASRLGDYLPAQVEAMLPHYKRVIELGRQLAAKKKK